MPLSSTGGIFSSWDWLLAGIILFSIMHLNKKDDSILSMTPKQVTHVRTCQRLLLIAQQTQRTSM